LVFGFWFLVFGFWFNTEPLALADQSEGQCHRSAHVMRPNHPTA